MISLTRYRELLREPYLAHVLLASVPGRLPMGVAGLAILMFVQHQTGSFAHAGATSALYVLGLAGLAPYVGRLIDRLGPRLVLIASAVLYPVALLTMVLLVRGGATWFWVAASTLLAGAALPPITICMRALFPRMLADPALLQTAYSIDSALIETVFIFGPALTAFFVAIDAPAGAVMFAAVCAAAGSAVFLRAPPIRDWQPPQSHTRRSLRGPLRYPQLRVIYAATLLYSTAFGLFEVAVSGYAAARGFPAAAGVILALGSVGSAVGALSYGSRDWSWTTTSQYVVAQLAMAAGIMALAPIENIYVFGLVSIFGCAPMAPVLASQSVLVSRIAPRALLAESFTWAATCLLCGVAAGLAAAGMMLEVWQPAWVMVAAATATAAGALIAWMGLPATFSEGNVATGL